MNTGRSPIALFGLSILSLLAAACAGKGAAPAAAPSKITDLKPTVILVSLDGFRPDYVNEETTPELRKLADEGVRAEKMIPVFPSLTFPNHYTIATGLYPEHHGIVANNFREADSSVVFSVGQDAITDQSQWWKGEPVWMTAERQGQKAASMFWVGSSAETKRPTYWKPYDKKFPREARVAQVLSWLDLPLAQRPTLITLYFEDVDSAGHAFGPGSQEVRDAARAVDRSIAELMSGLDARGIGGQVNLVITSDHGMAEVDPAHAIKLAEVVDPASIEVQGGGAFAMIYPKSQQSGAAANLAARLNRAGHLRAYLKEKLPKRFHFGKSSRIAPVVIVPEEGWTVLAPGLEHKGSAKGAHGYDPELPSMGATFIAHGPAFKNGYVAKPFANLHVYSLISKVLGLDPAPNDGSLKSIRAVLK